ncbi:MAG: ABC transporter permease [Candidatus Bipolaricaulia bacterium]
MAEATPNESTTTRISGRQGSPWTGLRAVFSKELADHLSSTRMRILELLILITAVGTVYMVISNISTADSGDPMLYLKLLTESSGRIPAFIGFMGFLIPLVAIALGFDSVNGEFNGRTLSRVLAQPIYRDAVLFGKFLAGLFTLALVLVAIWLLVMGLAVFRLGVPPTGEVVARGLLYIAAAIAYGGIWLALSMVFSIVFRQPATAALAAIAVWLFFTVFWGMLVGLVANAASQGQVAQAELSMALSRISPNTLYSESVLALLNPDVRALGIVQPSMQQFQQLQQSDPDATLSVGQSLVLIWPQLTAMIAAMLLLFAYGYVRFQRQEIRA